MIEHPRHSVLVPRGAAGGGKSVANTSMHGSMRPSVSLFVTSSAPRRIQSRSSRQESVGDVHWRRSSDSRRRVSGQLWDSEWTTVDSMDDSGPEPSCRTFRR